MCGRAGRPKFETEGQAIAIAGSEENAEEIEELYIDGSPEKIYSKLSPQPILRNHVLSLISSGIVKSSQEHGGVLRPDFLGSSVQGS